MKMKKNNLLILAVAALGFAACANDETTAVNEKLAESNAISFRANVAGNMRSADITTVNLTSFKAYALLNSSSAVYFAEDVFTKQGTTFTSANKHYWPSSGALDFFAYAPTTSTQYTHETTEDLQFVVTPSATASEQVDLVVANTDNKTKTGTYNPSDVYNPSAGSQTSQYGANGVPLNFRHAEAKVSIQFKNSNPNLFVTVKDAEICYLKTSGKYVYTGSDGQNDTDGENARNLKYSDWSLQTGTGSYAQDMETATGFSSSTPATGLPNSYILIPQQLVAATQYSATGSGKAFQGAYIKAKIKIQNGNTSSGAYIIGSAGNENANYQIAMWPLQQITWNPGYHYIYTVDLAGGGYFETNQDEEIGLDPILAGAEIKFVTVTVDTWDEANYTVGNMAFVSGGSTHTANVVAEAGQYTITITGLGANEEVTTVAVTGDAGAEASPTTGTAGSDGTFSFGLTVAANASTVSTKTFTITVTPETSSPTTITLTQAAAN